MKVSSVDDLLTLQVETDVMRNRVDTVASYNYWGVHSLGQADLNLFDGINILTAGSPTKATTAFSMSQSLRILRSSGDVRSGDQ